MSQPLDYKELLKKYMRHVVENEGVDFVDRINQYPDDVVFSGEEETALRKLSTEKFYE